jgi:hypothetical protein
MSKSVSALILLLAVLGILAAEDILPPDGVPQGWVRKAQVMEFPGAALYRHINGGAEMYHEHGFETLLVQDYVRDETEVRLEIYRMKTVEGAKAIFDAMSEGLKQETQPGQACIVDPYQLLFIRDRYLVSLTRFELGEESKTALPILAAWVDGFLCRLAGT